MLYKILLLAISMGLFLNGKQLTSADLIRYETDKVYQQEIHNELLKNPQILKQLESYTNENNGYILFGDSRTVGMSNVCDLSVYENTYTVAESAMGYQWAIDEGLAQINDIKNDDDINYSIISLFGINDLGNIDNYLNFYKQLSEEYDIILVSVNPIENHKHITNEHIEQFNQKLKEFANENGYMYIDTYNFLKENGYATVDGVHYAKETYVAIKDYIFLNIEKE